MEAKAVIHDVPPYLRVYDDGTVQRFLGTEFVQPGLDPQTGVSSTDVVLNPETGLSARVYTPTAAAAKLPLVVYFHGGAFCISSSGDPLYHAMLNHLVKQAHVILVSVNYRLAPEFPLPTAYEDSWAALQWVAHHFKIPGGYAVEIPMRHNVDFDRIFLGGDSAGANISHHLLMRVGSGGQELGEMKINGVVMVHPYFWGEEAMGAEAENPVFKAVVDKWWRFVCTSDRGCDDPWINPFVAGAPSLAGLGCERALVCVAGNDVLRVGSILLQGFEGEWMEREGGVFREPRRGSCIPYHGSDFREFEDFDPTMCGIHQPALNFRLSVVHLVQQCMVLLYTTF